MQRRASAVGGIEQRTQAIGAELIERSRSLDGGGSMQDRLTEWALADETFKVQLFRFVDVFPRLRSPESIYQHLTEYIQQAGVQMPAGMRAAIGAGGWMKGTLAKAIASQIDATAGRFIAGRDINDALPRLRRLWHAGQAATIDLLGEAVLSNREADAYHQRYLHLIDTLADEAATWEPRPALEQDHLGPIPRANISIKLSALAPRFDALDPSAVRQRLDSLLARAAERGVMVTFDIESYAVRELILSIFMDCCQRIDFPAGIAIQAYLRSGPDDAQRLIDWSRRTGRRVTVRLVKGAYWDHELIVAQERNWPVPVWLDKRETDACYERMSRMILAATPRSSGEGGLMLAVGSHNARSIAHALATAEHVGLPASAVEIQMLYGMADGLKAAAVEKGLRVRQYVPVGALAPGMAYLVRRLLENSSNQSWLLKGQDRKTDIAALLAPPQPPERPRQLERPSVDGFRNEPMRDFADPAQREAFGRAVARTRPASVAVDATTADADRAVAAAYAAFPSWRDADPNARAQCLLDAAELMRRQRDDLAAMMVHEASKPWRDADADVCEAIDFCVFYAMRAPAMFTPRRLGAFIGQHDETWYEPRGVAAVISPWNFPLAICCGMTAAALVTGNMAIVKPAEQTPAIARTMCELFWRAGVPRDVLHYLPGDGAIGAHLVRKREIAVIAFTGSKAVGLDILKVAADVDEPAGQTHVKQVVCEMGGKNAIIIDESADLDEAVVGVRDSAFGYAGQKCSACSRVIVLPGVRDEFVGRLVEATRHLRVGPASDPATDVPPVIDDEAAAKIRSYIEIGRREGELLIGGEGDGRLIPPHIFDRIRPEHCLFNEEVFGPVLSIVDAADFDEAIRLALLGPYRLTGGVYSRTPSHLQQARRQFRVGNLYLNRGITGALVGRQPFGGVGLSGLGTKAGGEDYLRHFTWPRSCSENTERRGFAPGLAD